jgi:hypothetical protein
MMKYTAGILILGVILGIAPQPARAQAPITTLTLGANQIGTVKTAQGITTRITFPDTVRDIICGDLYDASTGKGAFVVQRIDNDVFLKPITPKGFSNLFVKTGEKGDRTYGFDLSIVPSEQAFRMVTINEHASASPASAPAPDKAQGEKLLSATQQQAEEILRAARQQAEQLQTQANQRASEVYAQAIKRTEDLDRQSGKRAQQEVEARFVRSVIQGVREIKINESHVAAKNITLSLDSHMLIFDEKSYLRYMIKNGSDKEFSFSAISLETGAGKQTTAIPIRVVQGRAENQLKPGETIMGVIVFDPKAVGVEDKLTLFVRGEDKAEVARLSIARLGLP